MIIERPLTHEKLMMAIISKKIVLQQCKPLRKRAESDLERLKRQAAWLRAGW